MDHCVRLVGWQRGRLARDVVDDEVVDVEAHRPYLSKHCSVSIQTDSVVMWTLQELTSCSSEREGIANEGRRQIQGPTHQHRRGADQATAGRVGPRGDRQEARHRAKQCLSGAGGIVAISVGAEADVTAPGRYL